MEKNLLTEVTFKMRQGKRAESAFYSFWCFLMSLFGFWLLFMFDSKLSIQMILFFVFMIGVPFFGVIIFISSIVRARLTFSVDGVCFQSLFSSNHASWDEVTGFYNANNEVYLRIDKLNQAKTVQYNFPLSWFAKVGGSKKPYKADLVMEKLMAFAPHLFIEASEWRRTDQ